MTVHYDVTGSRPVMHAHAWADGGGAYAALIDLDGHGEPWRVTLAGDDVDTYSARTLDITPDVAASIMDEYALASDYAAAFYPDVLAACGPIPGATPGDYIILSHGACYAVPMP